MREMTKKEFDGFCDDMSATCGRHGIEWGVHYASQDIESFLVTIGDTKQFVEIIPERKALPVDTKCGVMLGNYIVLYSTGRIDEFYDDGRTSYPRHKNTTTSVYSNYKVLEWPNEQAEAWKRVAEYFQGQLVDKENNPGSVMLVRKTQSLFEKKLSEYRAEMAAEYGVELCD